MKASCSCGQLNLEYRGEIQRTSVCHCLECQKRTGSAFGFQTRLPLNQVTLKGESKIFKRTGDEGSVMSFHFCPECGSTLYWEADWLGDSLGVALGAFADPGLPAPFREIYINRKHHWVHVPPTLDASTVD